MIAELELLASRPQEALTAVQRGLDGVEKRGETYWHSELERLGAIALSEIGRQKDSDEALGRSAASAQAKGIVPLIGRIGQQRTLHPA